MSRVLSNLNPPGWFCQNLASQLCSWEREGGLGDSRLWQHVERTGRPADESSKPHPTCSNPNLHSDTTDKTSGYTLGNDLTLHLHSWPFPVPFPTQAAGTELWGSEELGVSQCNVETQPCQLLGEALSSWKDPAPLWCVLGAEGRVSECPCVLCHGLGGAGGMMLTSYF